MSTLPPGHFRLVPFVEPPVPAGSYLLTGAVSGLPGAVESLQSRVEITAPRYAMPPDQILSTYPPAGARGSFTSRLPQIVLRRRTLPWERSPDLDGDVTTTPTPWLALALIAEGEGQLLTDVPVAECVSSDVDLGDDADVPKGACLEVTPDVVNKIFPTQADLHLLCHVREVDLADTELALGDDDGWLAVVMSNRLPQPGTRYLACLINLEEQYPVLPVIPDLDLILTYTPGPAVADYRLEYTVTESSAHGTQLDAALMDLPLAGAGPLTEELPQPDGGGPRVAGPNAAGAAGAATTRASSFVTGAHGAPAQVGTGWTATAAGPAMTRAQDFGLKNKLALADGFAIGTFREPTLRFPVLAYWSFTCEERGDFQYLATNAHVRMLGHVIDGAETPDGDPIGPEHPATPGNTAQPGVTRELPLVAETGHVQLDHVSRAGEAAPAWFRGPFAAAAVPRSQAPEDPDGDPDHPPPPPLAHHADQLRRVVPDGTEDLGYAAAFEIGRLLALSQPGVVAALARWRQEAFGAARVSTVAGSVTGPLPDQLKDAVARPDPLITDPAAALRAPSVGARTARALIEALGEEADTLLGASRPVADPGAAVVHLRDVLRGGDKTLLDGFGIAVDTDDPDGVLDAVAAAPVRVLAETDGAVQLDALRARLEEAAAAVAADAMKPALPGLGPPARPAPAARAGSAGAPGEPDALDELLRARGEQGDRR
jgi:hypothetical protein